MCSASNLLEVAVWQKAGPQEENRNEKDDIDNYSGERRLILEGIAAEMDCE